jgi:hypothetical protein
MSSIYLAAKRGSLSIFNIVFSKFGRSSSTKEFFSDAYCTRSWERLRVETREKDEEGGKERQKRGRGKVSLTRREGEGEEKERRGEGIEGDKRGRGKVSLMGGREKERRKRRGEGGGRKGGKRGGGKRGVMDKVPAYTGRRREKRREERRREERRDGPSTCIYWKAASVEGLLKTSFVPPKTTSDKITTHLARALVMLTFSLFRLYTKESSCLIFKGSSIP